MKQTDDSENIIKPDCSLWGADGGASGSYRLDTKADNSTDSIGKDVPDCPFEPMHPSYLNRDDEFFMKIAYNNALKAWREGEVPIGAVIEYGGEVIAQAYNRVEGTKDPTAHAEILAITQASAKLGDWRLNGATLYVTKEPCPMCSGACVMSRLSRVVYAIPDAKMGFLGGVMKFHDVPTLNHSIEVSSGVLYEECLALLKTFFALKRKGV